MISSEPDSGFHGPQGFDDQLDLNPWLGVLSRKSRFRLINCGPRAGRSSHVSITKAASLSQVTTESRFWMKKQKQNLSIEVHEQKRTALICATSFFSHEFGHGIGKKPNRMEFGHKGQVMLRWDGRLCPWRGEKYAEQDCIKCLDLGLVSAQKTNLQTHLRPFCGQALKNFRPTCLTENLSYLTWCFFFRNCFNPAQWSLFFSCWRKRPHPSQRSFSDKMSKRDVGHTKVVSHFFRFFRRVQIQRALVALTNSCLSICCLKGMHNKNLTHQKLLINLLEEHKMKTTRDAVI